MIYKLDGFTKVDYEVLIRDTLCLLSNVDVQFKPKFYIYGEFKGQNMTD